MYTCSSKPNSLAVSKVSERALLVDDANAHALDVVGRLAERPEPCVDDVHGLDGHLRVELGWVQDLEEHVLHQVCAVQAVEFERSKVRFTIITKTQI
jgi:hypothetical protein